VGCKVRCCGLEIQELFTVREVQIEDLEFRFRAWNVEVKLSEFRFWARRKGLGCWFEG